MVPSPAFHQEAQQTSKDKARRMTTDFPPNPPSVEKRISTVIGDRLCIKCSFNLSGQPVVRESVYGMAIVRCPECSTIASLQEHPLLGRWAGRFAAALAAIWLLVLISGLFGTGGILFGMSQGSLETGSTRLAEHIAKQHAAWFEKATDAERAGIARMYGGATPQLGVSAYTWVDNTWWKKQDPAAMIAELGGHWRAINPTMVEILFWTAFIAIILKAVWSVFLLHARR